MNKKIYAGAGIIIATFVIWLVIGAISASAQPGVMNRKIVVFKEGVLNEPAREALVGKFGGFKVKNLDLIGGKAVLLPPKAEKALRQHPGVLRIDDDVIVEILVKNNGAKPTPTPPSQTLPWGIDRVDAEKIWGITTGDPIKVAVVDTGIDLSHPDLKTNIKGGYNAINPIKSANDDNGHGTHVAGIIGAIDNTIGVIGVSPKADLYAVKVLDRRGSGYLSDVIEGIDWAIQNKMQVINMSLGASSDVLSFHEAVQRAYQAGVIQVAAAGNNGGAVLYPAAYPEVIAVSATDNTNTIASWSSRGSAIDLSAPGVSIYSTYNGQTYKTLSGTSMASPHVAGTAALVLTTAVGAYDSIVNGKWDPIEIQNKLQDTAVDLGTGGYDNLYGHGLVNALSAVTQ